MSNMRLKDFRLIKVILGIIKKLWAISSATALACIILYWFYGGLFAFFLLIFALTGILYHAEDQLIYHPDMPSHSRVFVPLPSMYGLPYENITYKALDGTMLRMFLIKHQGDTGLHAPVVVFFHGNAGNMGHRLTYILGFYKALNYNVLLLEYRGYGLSSGCPSEEGLYMDAKAALDYLYTRHDINHSKIILFGRSLGGAVAIDLAMNIEYSNRIWCLIVENTFTSVPDMAKVLLNWKPIQYIPLCFYKNQYLSLNKISSVTIPTMFISGQADTLVPPAMMTILHSRCSSALKYLYKVEGGTHNETWTKKGYYQAIASFVDTVKDQGTLTQAPLKHDVDVHRVILDV